MTLSQGRQYLAIPGPSVVPDAVLQAMHRASPNIYTGEIVDIAHSLMPDLRAIARTEAHVAMYIANGHAVWEAAVSNVCSRGDKVLVLSTGAFAHGWSEMAAALGVEVELIEFGNEADIDPVRLEERLRADTTGEIKAVLSVHVDTSTSVKSDVVAVRKAMDAAGHGGLLMADCMASFGCDFIDMDGWGVDVLTAGCQKGLMTPAGLGFVFFNDKADRARETANCVTHFWNWRPRAKPEHFFQISDGTAPTHHFFGLRAALDMIKAEGLDHVYARHETLARTVWAAVDAWATTGALKLNVPRADQRGHSVTSIYAGPNDGDRLRAWVEEMCGVTLGIGLGRDPADAYFRIGHMGHVNAHMVMGVLGSIDAGLKALDIPHGAGALDAMSAVISKG